MKKTSVRILVVVPLLVWLGMWEVGCAKKVTAPMKVAKSEPPASPMPAAAAPTITLSASPNVVAKGQTTTLSWVATNTTKLALDNGIGLVPNTGQRILTPAQSTTFTAEATGPGGEAVASTRITVETPVAASAPAPLSDREFFEKHIRDVFFDFDKYDIRGDQQAASSTDAAALAERPGIKIMIEGHCDERGSEKYNLALGDKRANVERAYLVARGVPESRIDTVSYGKERPFDSGHDEEAWAKNRRDHFVMK